VEMHSFYCIQRVDYRKWVNQMDFAISVKITQKLYNIYFFQYIKIKPIIEKLNTMIIALCDQNYVLNEEYYVGYIFV
jgi:hypothetical protein